MVLQHPGLWRGNELSLVSYPSVPTGFSTLDPLLPGGGWPRGALTEILPEREGVGEIALFAPAIASMTARQESVFWIGPPHIPHALALQAWNIDIGHVVIVKTSSASANLWAAEQTLRSGACGAVLIWMAESVIGGAYPILRRLQLAAATYPVMGVLFRKSAAATQASPLPLRLPMQVRNGAAGVRILKRRGTVIESFIELHRTVSRVFPNAVDRSQLLSIAPRRLQPAVG